MLLGLPPVPRQSLARNNQHIGDLATRSLTMRLLACSLLNIVKSPADSIASASHPACIPSARGPFRPLLHCIRAPFARWGDPGYVARQEPTIMRIPPCQPCYSSP